MLSGTHGYVSMKQFKSLLFPEGTNLFLCVQMRPCSNFILEQKSKYQARLVLTLKRVNKSDFVKS